ncbi:MAG: beta-galactosidase, partial [Plesiomonas sp.]
MRPVLGIGLMLCAMSVSAAADSGVITVRPQPLDTILTNPGIGVETFQNNWGVALSAAQYPQTTVNYYRFYWNELEPQEGQINFAMLDSIIAQARAQTPSKQIALRVMDLDEPTSGSKLPRW